jgi:hypothetical protein
MIWQARFVYGVSGSQTDWTTTLPVRPWTKQRGTRAGGSRIAASGTPAGYVVRKDYIVTVPLRLYEDELADLYAMLDWSEIGQLVRWYPEATDAALFFDCYIDAPTAGDDLPTPRNDDDGAGIVYDVMLVLRAPATTFATLGEYHEYNA